MNFTSIEFLVFVCATFVAYYAIGRGPRSQIGLLVVASAVFYAWERPELLALLMTVAAVAAAASFAIVHDISPLRRSTILCGSIVFLLGTLGYFKYGGLLFTSVVGIDVHPAWQRFFLNIPLPIGISFYIFHAISLIVDVSRGDYRSHRKAGLPVHFQHTFLYIIFFPQLIAGPIVKAKDFYPQIQRKSFADVPWEAAFRLLTLGYFFKMVVADNLAVQTQAMSYPHFESLASSKLFALIIAYSCQIFADFFGYSLIAMGLAALFGYRLPVNFNRPYLATSFLDFWRRWHMSLSAWLRDYLYIPLGGSRRGRTRTYINLFLVMFLGGLWHGAAWSFAIWGTLHGLALALERPFLDSRFYRSDLALIKIVRGVVVFAIVSLAWVFFKFQDHAQAIGYIQAIFRNTSKGVQPQEIGVVYVYCLPVLLYHILPALRRRGLEMQQRAWPYAAMLFLLLTNSGIPGAFIYFQF